MATENTELQDRVDSSKKEIAALQKQLNEEQLKYKRDIQSLADSKKHLGAELNQLKGSRSGEIQKLTNQLEDKNLAMKKLENQLANVCGVAMACSSRIKIALGAQEQCVYCVCADGENEASGGCLVGT